VFLDLHTLILLVDGSPFPSNLSSQLAALGRAEVEFSDVDFVCSGSVCVCVCVCVCV
jgi:hypothetical protein